MEKKYWHSLDKTNLVGYNLRRGKNDYKSGAIFYGMFLARNIKFSLTINECSFIEEHKNFEGFIDSKRLLDRYKYFKLAEGKKISAMLPKT